MGRYSSDSEEEKKRRKKKKKKRSRSRSRSVSVDSRQSSKAKKSKKKKKKRSYSRSPSRSPDRYRRSRSYDRYRSRSRSHSRRSRSRSRTKYRRSSSRGRYSRSRSRSWDRRRRRSKSPDSHSRSSRRSRSNSPGSRKNRRNKSKEREDPCLRIPGFLDMAPADQARIRMQMALKAAAVADEKLKGDNSKSSSSSTLQDSLAFSQAIQDIESSGFSAASFKSSRGDKREEKEDRDEFMFGTAGELRLDPNKKPVILDVDKEELAHPSLYADVEEKMNKWIQRLTELRRKKLEGEAL